MKYPTHQLIGFVAALPVAEHAQPLLPAAGLVLAGSILGSLLPDADHADAHIYKLTAFERRHILVGLIGWLARLLLRPLAWLPHRGPVTHGFPALVLVGTMMIGYPHAAASPLVFAFAQGAAIGYLAHLLADGATTSGLPGWPFTRRDLHTVPSLLRVRTGSLGELAYAFAALLALLVEIYLATTGVRHR